MKTDVDLCKEYISDIERALHQFMGEVDEADKDTGTVFDKLDYILDTLKSLDNDVNSLENEVYRLEDELASLEASV